MKKIIKKSISTLSILSLVLPWSASNQAMAQQSARIIQAFGESCPITAGGISNPINQARQSIARSQEMLMAIQADRDGNANCAGAVRLAQQQLTSMTTSEGGSTTGEPQYAPPPPVTGTPPTPPTPISTDDTYNRAIDSLLAEDQISALNEQISTLQRESDNTATTAERRMQIDMEIARLQGQITTVGLDERSHATRARLSAYRHVSQAGSALSSALRSCQGAADIMAQLTPAALNVGAALGDIGGAAALAIDAVADLIGSIVDYFRDSDLRDGQAGLEAAFAPTAVRCAYMTMGQQFCKTVEQRRMFLSSGENPERLLEYDQVGQCSLQGFSLLEDNVRERGGLSDSISRIVHGLSTVGTPDFSETAVDRIIFGSGGDTGMLDRIQNIDNYYEYVERNIEQNRQRIVERIGLYGGPTTPQGAPLADQARRLRSLSTDAGQRRTRAHNLRAVMETYRDGVQNNFDPNVSNSTYIENLRTSLQGLLTEENATSLFEQDLNSMVDVHRESLGIGWNFELQLTNHYASGVVPPTSVLQERNRLRHRLQALTLRSQTESMRLAAIGVSELGQVATEHRRESIGHAVDTQMQNLQVMGQFLRPQLEQNIIEINRRMSMARAGDDTVGATRDRLIGLCESSLTLASNTISGDIRRICGPLIYRREGSRNITFANMYSRLAGDEGRWSTDLVCHQFNHPDTVARER